MTILRHHPASREGAEHSEGVLMKGMPGLYYSQGGGGEGRAPRWVGTVLYVDADTAEARRLYDREDAMPLPPADANSASPRPSISSYIRRMARVAGAPG